MSPSPSPSEPDEPDPPQEPLKIESEWYKIDFGKKVIRIQANTTISEFKQRIKINRNYIIKNNIGNEISKDLVKNGYFLEVEDLSFKIIVIGDISGNGLNDVLDLARLRDHLIGKTGRILTGNSLEAADINESGDINILDLTRLRKLIVE